MMPSPVHHTGRATDGIFGSLAKECKEKGLEKEAPCPASRKYVPNEASHGFCLEVGRGAGYIAFGRVRMAEDAGAREKQELVER